MFSIFIPIWRLKTVTHESKSCSYCLLSRREPRRKTKHLTTHLQTNSGLFLDGHLHLWQSKMEGCLELFHSGNHADLIVAVTSWRQLWGCSGLTLQGNMFFCDQDRSLHRRLSRGCLWLSWETWHRFFMWTPKSRQPLCNADGSSPSVN